MPPLPWYRYGIVEGLPRMLDLLERKGIKMTSHMIGAAVEMHPQLAKEIVERGHEPAGHGWRWDKQWILTRDQETKFISNGASMIEKITGFKPIGFNAPWLRGTVNTLEILQELGFLYHIDDVSRDEPSLVIVKGKPFVVVPYAVYLNDIRGYEQRYLSTQDFL